MSVEKGATVEQRSEPRGLVMHAQGRGLRGRSWIGTQSF